MCPIKHKKNDKWFTSDFYKMVVDLYHSGQRLSNLSSKYSVSKVTNYAWIKSLLQWKWRMVLP